MANEQQPAALGWDVITAVFDTLHPEINPVHIGFTPAWPSESGPQGCSAYRATRVWLRGRAGQGLTRERSHPSSRRSSTVACVNGGSGAYRYVGPVDLVKLVRPDAVGEVMRSFTDFTRWIAARSAAELAEPFTFVVDLDGFLRLAPRRSEHVLCAGGGPVLSAGEMGFAVQGGRWMVDRVSNQSTGYCPDTRSWAAVTAALERTELAHPERFTDEVVFRRCAECGERSVVKDGDFACVFCGGDLPTHWNVDDVDSGRWR